jgi:hypothetical protein
VFAGLIIGSGPAVALFTIGISSKAQPELYVPMSPTNRSAPAYAFAFELHLKKSNKLV